MCDYGLSCISEAEFIACCKEIESWNTGWTVVIKQPHTPFLKKTFFKAAKDFRTNVCPGACEQLEPAEPRQEELIYECHVTYSDSYCNPVLYFSVHNSAGQMIRLHDVLKNCTQVFGAQTVTQHEHPVHLVPYYQLHPCHTADFMSHLVKISAVDSNVSGKFNYVQAWMSVVMAKIGLEST